MSNAPIDRAYLVVRDHCDGAKLMGRIVGVESVEPPHPVMFLRCLACKAEYAHNEAHALIAGEQAYHPLAWLKRLPPVEEHETTEEAITA